MVRADAFKATRGSNMTFGCTKEWWEMKVFGRIARHCSEDGLVELSETTFVASPDVLRKIAAFLSRAADQMEQRGERFNHSHIQDEVEGWGDHEPEWADVIVAS
jgi:hypothetical protein